VEPEKTAPRERAKDLLIELLVPDWRPTAQQGLWAIRIVLATFVVLGILTLVGQPFGITLWDWLKLLVIPVVIAGGGLWFNAQQRERELGIAEQRAQHEALQAFLDQIGQLLLEKNLRGSVDGDIEEARNNKEEAGSLARGRTLAVLQALGWDPKRKRILVQFLYEAKLIIKGEGGPVISLIGADLSGADLREIYLGGADLSETNLRAGLLWRADLRQADLFQANLRMALLRRADLRDTSLRGTDLSRTDLREGLLQGADLSYANL
jgi:hypothetical protein